MSAIVVKYIKKVCDFLIENSMEEFEGMKNNEQIEGKFLEIIKSEEMKDEFEFDKEKTINTGLKSIKSAIDECVNSISEKLKEDEDPDLTLGGSDAGEISVHNSNDEEEEDEEGVKPQPSAKLSNLLKPTAEKEALQKKPMERKSTKSKRPSRGMMLDDDGNEVPKPSAADLREEAHKKACDFQFKEPMDVSKIGRVSKNADNLLKVIAKYKGKVLTDVPAVIKEKAEKASDAWIETVTLKSNHLVIKYSYTAPAGWKEDAKHSFSASYGAANPSRKVATKEKKEIKYTKMEQEIIKAFETYAKDSKIKDPFDDLSLLSTDYIYDLKSMEILPGEDTDYVIVDYLNNVVLNNYAIGYAISESDEFIYRKRDYNHLFDLIRVSSTYNGTVNQTIMWNVYKHRYAIIYHDKFSDELKENWDTSLQALDARVKIDPKAYDMEKVKVWRAILKSEQCYNVICRGFPATAMFEKGLKKIVQDIESIRLLMGPLFYISPIFSPYAIYCKDMVVTKTTRGRKGEEPTVKPLPMTSTFVTNLIRHVTLENDEALNYDDCVWCEGLHHTDNFNLETIPDVADMHSFRCLVTKQMVAKQTSKTEKK